MTNREILAELKKSYEYLRDIRENGCADHCSGQMEENISKLDNAISNVEDIYFDFYKTLNKEDLRVKSLEHKVDGDKVYICRCVDGDYEVGGRTTLYDLLRPRLLLVWRRRIYNGGELIWKNMFMF